MTKKSDAITPRLLTRQQAAQYLGGVSLSTVERLINAGAIPIVRLPVENQPKAGRVVQGTSRRILIDRNDLDALITQWRETRE